MPIVIHALVVFIMAKKKFRNKKNIHVYINAKGYTYTGTETKFQRKVIVKIINEIQSHLEYGRQSLRTSVLDLLYK
jgi:hypothetical protein